ncbi:uncharacterized protein PV09_03053 [Verruconis gallopava]|uniref:Uncharacterized protein n=1 Tax=Verruconis gallopava TaxID=253628 RepID=A0A0D2B3K6_9PEZI|nr:uncharacterized protein PV09_03053 [Verruconis gallopava]KIW05849.1 hypothetical protein PV09_03053 [Verruconis gallopava]
MLRHAFMLAAFMLAAFTAVLASSSSFNTVLSPWRFINRPDGLPTAHLSSRQPYPQPVLTLPYVPGIMDVTLKHFCLWSQSVNPSNPNEANITYSEFRVNDSACRSCCGTSSGSFLKGRGCHQAPFAKALESSAMTGCVAAYENAFQGWWLGQWFRDIKGGRDTAFGEGLPILVKVEGLDCASVKEGDLVSANVVADGVSICHADDPAVISPSGTEKRLIPPSIAQPISTDPFSLLLLPLGDLPSGNFTLRATIAGAPLSVRLWDNVGDDLVVGAIEPNAENGISVAFSGPAIGVGLMVTTNSADASLNWAFEGEIRESNGGDTPTTVIADAGSGTRTASAEGVGTTSVSDILSMGTTQPPVLSSPTTTASSDIQQSSDATALSSHLVEMLAYLWACVLIVWK